MRWGEVGCIYVCCHEVRQTELTAVCVGRGRGSSRTARRGIGSEGTSTNVRYTRLCSSKAEGCSLCQCGYW